jgi:ubiquinone/menaquinone biosynthesis C-methylase UbiE
VRNGRRRSARRLRLDTNDKVVGIDLNPNMLAVARAMAEREGRAVA